MKLAGGEARGKRAYYPHYGGSMQNVSCMEPAIGRFAVQTMRRQSRSPRTALPMSDLVILDLHPDSLIVAAVRLSSGRSRLAKGHDLASDCPCGATVQSQPLTRFRADDSGILVRFGGKYVILAVCTQRALFDQTCNLCSIP